MITHKTSGVLYSLVVLCLLGVHISHAQSEEPTLAPEVERISFISSNSGEGTLIRVHATQPILDFTPPIRVDNILEMVLHGTTFAQGIRQDPSVPPILQSRLLPRGEDLVLRFQLDERLPVQPEFFRDEYTQDLYIRLVPTAASTYTTPSTPPAPYVRNTDERPTDARAKWVLDTIVIDAGHGGPTDKGAVGVGGVEEKDLTLALALLLGGRLERELGIRVVYTRTSDVAVPLWERGRIANESGGKLFISIHANSVARGIARGTETFILGLHKTDDAREVMERENSVIRLEDDQDRYQGLDRAAVVRYTLAQSAYLRMSEALASHIEDQFANRAKRKSRGVKQAGFQVLYGASMPAVLVELGFINNRREASFLKSHAGQAMMADAIFEAVRTFKLELDKDLHLSQSQ